MRKYWQIWGLRAPNEDAGAEVPPVVADQAGEVGGTGQDSQEAVGASEPAASAPVSSQEPAVSGESGQNQERQPWFYNRIDKLTRRAKEAEEALQAERARREELERRYSSPANSEPEAQGSPQAMAQQPQATLSESEIQRRAAQLVETQNFTRKANEVWEKGSTAYPDFVQNVTQLTAAAGGQLPYPFVSAVLELDAPEAVLQALAKDPARAFAIMEEPNLVRMGSQLARFEASLTKPAAPRISSAPPPVAPKVASGTAAPAANVYDDGLSLEEFMAIRNGTRK